jgi:MFS family permease
MRHIPAYAGQRMAFDVAGAFALTVGSGLLVLALAVIPQPGVPVWAVFTAFATGVVALIWFAWHCTRVAHPFVEVGLLLESRFARSSLAGFAQMFCLGATLLAVPLYLTGHGYSSSVAGLVIFAVPAAMVVLGPLVGRWMDRLRPRRVLRGGLIVLFVSHCALAALVTRESPALAVLAVSLAVTGIGIALVQTPAATGATRSPAGTGGTGLGMYNLLRFGGSAMGAAWVAVGLEVAGYPAVFAASAVVIGLGLAASFMGPDPQGPVGG